MAKLSLVQTVPVDPVSDRIRLRPASLPAANSGVDSADFRNAFRQLAGGVSVITVGREGDRTGLTATSVSSLSADPPSVFFGLSLTSSSLPVLRRQACFAINLLSASQKAVADRFSGRGGQKGEARYAGASWHSEVTGAALLDGALAAIECELEEIIERHSHAIVIGRVRAVRLGQNDPSLIYWRGDYERLGWTEEEARSGLGLNAY